ncbi:PaaI family thioesterase [Roseburia hominis]
MLTLDEAKEYFGRDRYATEVTGIEILEVGEHYAKCMLKLDSRHKNATGNVMGGVMFTLADFVFAISTNTKEVVTVTTVSQISYLGAPKGEVLYGESHLLKDGRRTCFYEILITDNLGNAVAKVAVNGTHVKC